MANAKRALAIGERAVATEIIEPQLHTIGRYCAQWSMRDYDLLFGSIVGVAQKPMLSGGI